eukprot:3723238-Amphidinium_carterae.1
MREERVWVEVLHSDVWSALASQGSFARKPSEGVRWSCASKALACQLPWAALLSHYLPEGQIVL